MARRKIREYDGKKLLYEYFSRTNSANFQKVSALLLPSFQSILVAPETDLEALHLSEQQRYVVKPDQLFGKRKQYGLVLLNATSQEVKNWITERRNKSFSIVKATDVLTHFLIEPYIPHQQEYYVSLTSDREGDLLQFSALGGAGIEERWNSVVSFHIPVGTSFSPENFPSENVQIISFLQELRSFFEEMHFTSLEINPFVFDEQGKLHLLDLVAEVDDCASFKNLWQELTFPQSFGRPVSSEEEYIQQLDKDSGASLKLTLLHQQGKVWNILSGGGASIISLDSLTNAGLGREIANYGEYSGNPTPEESYQYAKTVLKLMTKEIAVSDKQQVVSGMQEIMVSSKGKVLLIAGAIANFTDVEKTFSGIVKALEEYAEQLRNEKTKIIVRRGGPNYEKGLQLMKDCGEKLGLSMEVYGPEMPLAQVAERVKEMLGSKKNEN